MRGILLAIGMWGAVGASIGLSADRPNVVVFLADDAGWGDFSCSGNTTVQTPHIDSLARGGATLNRFFVCAVCAPTRAEFLTGRYHPRTGVYGVSTGQERMNLDEKTIADAFHAAGYATGAFGKWHNGSQWPYHPMARGFDEYYGHTSGHWGEYFDPPLEHNGQMVRDRGYIVDLCTDRALDIIRRHADPPFFCFVPFTTPHSPWSVPQEYWERFRDKPITQPASAPEREIQDHTRCALAMMENQDDNVGRVLGLLEQLDLADNTIVVYFSDNGPNSWRWNGGMRGVKGSTDEGGLRSVCLLRWPGRIPTGRVVENIAGAIDLLPTLLALSNVPRVGDKPLDGRDLTPLILDATTEWPDRMIFSRWARQTTVRTQNHRLDAQGRVYDMVADPEQARPMNQQQPELACGLAEAVTDWEAELLHEMHAGDVADQRERVFPIPGAVVDTRPFPLGYREFPRTWLPARDGQPYGAIRRSSQAPNCSYFVNWTSLDDSVVWNVSVETAGEYAVEVLYTCPQADAGTLIALSFGNSQLEGRVAPAWDPPLYTHQDTLPRTHGESQMKEFRTLHLGTIHLPEGQGPLTLRALEIPGRQVMDLRAITLTLR